MEYKTLPLGEIKADDDRDDGKKMTFKGHGAAFGNVDSYGDVIEAGAFASWLSDVKAGKQPWPAMLSQHGAYFMTAEDMTPVGAWLDLAEDGKGLKVEGQFADTPRGSELYTLTKMEPRPALTGLSIGYIAKEWEPRSKPEDPRRRLKRIDVMEISPVTFPANRSALITGVKAIQEMESLSQAEEFLKDHGMSKKQAEVLVSRIKALGTGDPASEDSTGDPVVDDAAIAAFKAATERFMQSVKQE